MKAKSIFSNKEACFYQKKQNNLVLCTLCPHNCLIENGKNGKCQVRVNVEGKLFTKVYGRTSVQHVNKVEKKPLFHFFPGTNTYSIATHGCNFHCGYCINWQISQASEFSDTNQVSSPEAIVQAALHAECQSISYTYVEPTIFYEYAFDIAKVAHHKGLKNIFKTNGFMNIEALEQVSPYLDAANVDLKTFSNRTYNKFGGHLAPILSFLKKAKSLGIWLEITTVIIPNLNDSVEELQEIAHFISNELGRETPWHLCRFFPSYKMNDFLTTPLDTIEKAFLIGQEAGLQYVYYGNLSISGKQDTVCPKCKQLLIARDGFKSIKNNLQNNFCPNCQFEIAGINLGLNYRN